MINKGWKFLFLDLYSWEREISNEKGIFIKNIKCCENESIGYCSVKKWDIGFISEGMGKVLWVRIRFILDLKRI